MDYQKLDAPLAMALNDVQDNVQESLEPSLVVFIHTKTPPDSAAIDFLERLGVSNVTSDKNVFTATLSPNGISQLSEQPWVQYLKLSQKLRLVNHR
jgi:hypothetical protein